MSQSRRIPAFLHNNGLLLAWLGLFAVFFVGMVVSGAATYNQEQQEHGSHEQVSVLTYLTTGDFAEATFENWESEFLQMGMYVVLTAFLFQKGSSESKRSMSLLRRIRTRAARRRTSTHRGRSAKAV